MFLLATVAVVQTTFYIPIFSDIFHPDTTTSTNSVTPETPTPPTPTPLDPSGGGEETLEVVYKFSGIDANYEKVDFILEIENLTKEQQSEENLKKYKLYLVKKVDATDEFLSAVTDLQKDSNKIQVTSTKVKGTFTTYIHNTGVSNIKPNTDYCIVLTKEDKIIKTASVKTKGFDYITSVSWSVIPPDIYGDRYLDIRLTYNAKFEGFTLYFQLYNLTSNEKAEGKDSLIPKELLDAGSHPLMIFLKTEPEHDYQLKIYCLTDDPESIYYTDTEVKDEITYYLIYTDSNKITI